jgi:hypothetical protein
MTRLKMAFDLVHADFRMVQVLDDAGNYIASIYPANGGIKIVSRHLATVVERDKTLGPDNAVIKFSKDSQNG